MPVCAIYARVSDESQVKGDSLSHQIAYCQEIARRRGLLGGEPWITPENLVYVDEGITGTSLVRRTQMQRLIKDARMRQFEVVLFKGISRFARDTVDALVMLRTLLSCGVRVIAMEENFDSTRDNAEFVFTIHSALAQAESEKTAVRVRLGAAQKAKQGKWNGQPPDGYVLNRDTQKLEIDEAFAPIICRIFGWYLAGHGVRKIVDLLYECGLNTKRGNRWSQRNIARLLRNPAYAGDVVYGRRAKKFAMPDEGDFLTRRKQTVWVRDDDRVIVCKDAHPAIVDRETFEHVAKLLEARRTVRGQTGKAHLLTRGLLKCPCGSSMGMKYNRYGTAYYRCLGQVNQGKAFCGQKYLRADEVEAAVLARVKADVVDVLELDAISVNYDAMHEVLQRVSDVRRQFEGMMHKSQLLFDRFADGVLSNDQYTRMNGDIRERMNRLQQEERALLESEKSAGRGEHAEGFVRDAIHHLLGESTPDVRTTRQLLEILVEHVLVNEHGVQITYRFENPLRASV